MRYLTIKGEKKKIPNYPHHKHFVYKSYLYFEVKSLLSFVTQEGLFYVPRRIWQNFRAKCMIPLVLMIDPTSACNLRCKGCWASDYKKNSNISYEKLDELFTDARKLGIYYIFMTGGEPLIRKDDILKLCRKHSKMCFGIFTNGTLVDEPLAEEIEKLGNVNLFLSIDGFRNDNDERRGTGTFDKVMTAMDILGRRDIGFGFSLCYHSKNYQTVTSDEFLDFVRDRGAWFGWMFNYMPVGSDTDMSLCCNAEQRAYVKDKISAYQKKHRFTIIDFANSGHKSIGCIAAANDFAHINANGDLEPCVFCHYSDVNINDMPLVEALRSPFFKKFRNHKPFSNNALRPCPLVDVPEAIVHITKSEGIKSTHISNPETPEQLAAKTKPLAEQWAPMADKLFKEMPYDEKRRFGILTKVLLWGNKKFSDYTGNLS